MANLLLDTSVIIDLSKKGIPAHNFYANDTLNVAVITLGELSDRNFSTKKIPALGEKRQNYIKDMLSHCHIIEMLKTDDRLYNTYAEIHRFMINRATQSIFVGQNDLWIIANALSKNLFLVTLDKKQEKLYNLFLLYKSKK